jgi:hypothetical protein
MAAYAAGLNLVQILARESASAHKFCINDACKVHSYRMSVYIKLQILAIFIRRIVAVKVNESVQFNLSVHFYLQ